MIGFDELATKIQTLPPPLKIGELRVEWLCDRAVGVGKDVLENHCLLFVGASLNPLETAVASSLRHGNWQLVDGSLIEGALLKLPPGEAFRTATTAIVAEADRLGAGSRRMSEVFAEIEEFIALVLRRVLLPPDFVLGLIGELLILAELLGQAKEQGVLRRDPTAMWRGHKRNARDFELGATSFEVKTTSMTMSRHHISSLDQVEPRLLDGGATESLSLISIGLARGSGGNLSVAKLTKRVLELLQRDSGDEGEQNDAQKLFLERLENYGPSSVGYKHNEMQDLDLYSEPYTTTFAPRVYNMNDEEIRIIRSSDLALSFPHVFAKGLTYSVDLPPVVPGAINNPRVDIRPFLRGHCALLVSDV